jgi:hypothetical protein
MTTAIFKTTCTMCETIANATKSFANGVWNFFESVGRARAAAELSRQGLYKEAKALMLKEHG